MRCKRGPSSGKEKLKLKVLAELMLAAMRNVWQGLFNCSLKSDVIRDCATTGACQNLGGIEEFICYVCRQKAGFRGLRDHCGSGRQQNTSR
jgi:hypothetical protein